MNKALTEMQKSFARNTLLADQNQRLEFATEHFYSSELSQLKEEL